jgi:uncharacterized membrane protein
MKRESAGRGAVSNPLPAPATPRPSTAPAPPVPLAVVLMIVAHAALYSAIGAIKLAHALYDDFDLAIFSQAVDRLLAGSLFSSIRGMRWLGDHASLNLFLVAPLYAVARSPLTLLVVQSVALALGALPAYRLAARELGDRRAGIVMAAAYLLHPVVGYVNLFEFHPEALSVTPLLFAFDALRTGRHARLALWSALALLGREDVALVVGMMGFHAWIARVPRAGRAAAVCCGLAVLSLVLSFGVLRPLFAGPQSDYGLMYRAWGGTPLAVLGGIAAHPVRALAALIATPGNPTDSLLKQQYWLHLLLPLAFVPLLSPGTLVITLPIVLEHLLSMREAQHTVVFQYAALVVPFVFAAATLGLRDASHAAAPREAGAAAGVVRIGLAAVSAGTIAGQLLFGPLVGIGALQAMKRPQPIAPSAGQLALEPQWRGMLARVPDAGSVVASFQFLPRLSSRDSVHSLHHLLSGRYTFSSAPYPVPEGIGAVIADLGAARLLDAVDLGTARRWWDLIAKNGLSPVASADDVVLLLRGAPAADLCSRTEAQPEQPAPVTFGDSLVCLGHDRAPAPVASGGIVPIRTYWLRTGAVPDLQLAEIVVVDRGGAPLLRRLHFLGYTIHPPREWADREVVRETYRLQLPRTTKPGRYGILLRLSGVLRPGVLPTRPATGTDGFVEIGGFEVVAPGSPGG